MKENILKKIEKLFALANNNPNAQEAEQAMMKAVKLMNDYNIQESELYGKTKKVYKEFQSTKAINTIEANLAKVIAESMQTKVIFEQTKNKRYISCFFGYEANARAALECFERVLKIIRKGANLECKKCGLRARQAGTSVIKNGYNYGFIQGMKTKLDEQCRALQIVVPEDVKEEFYKEYKVEPVHTKGIRYSINAYNNGFDDGVRTNNASKLKGGA